MWKSLSSAASKAVNKASAMANEAAEALRDPQDAAAAAAAQQQQQAGDGAAAPAAKAKANASKAPAAAPAKTPSGKGKGKLSREELVKYVKRQNAKLKILEKEFSLLKSENAQLKQDGGQPDGAAGGAGGGGGGGGGDAVKEENRKLKAKMRELFAKTKTMHAELQNLRQQQQQGGGGGGGDAPAEGTLVDVDGASNDAAVAEARAAAQAANAKAEAIAGKMKELIARYKKLQALRQEGIARIAELEKAGGATSNGSGDDGSADGGGGGGGAGGGGGGREAVAALEKRLAEQQATAQRREAKMLAKLKEIAPRYKEAVAQKAALAAAKGDAERQLAEQRGLVETLQPSPVTIFAEHFFTQALGLSVWGHRPAQDPRLPQIRSQRLL